MSRVLPIIFNTEMVRGIVDDRKAVTRRVVKKSQCTFFTKKEPRDLQKKDLYYPYDIMTDAELIANIYRSQYNPGDILYVRETWAFIPCIGCDGKYKRKGGPINCYEYQAVEYDDGESISDGCFVYRADCPYPEKVSWRPSIHMPKQAARIWLKVTNLYVERLKNMSLDDFLKEGVIIRPESFSDPENAYQQAKTEFIHIWDSTIKKPDLEMYGWDASPWTWVIEFERCERPDEDKCQR